MTPDTTSSALNENTERSTEPQSAICATEANAKSIIADQKNTQRVDDAAVQGIKPDKTYAAAAYEAVAREEQMESDSQSPAESAPEDYTTDTEDYSDSYTEESIFSDSNYGDENDVTEDEEADARKVPAAATYDTFSSGAVSPSTNGPLRGAHAADALAPSHRFVSQTPWGSSTGRLTRDQRHKERLWADPDAKDANNGQEQGLAGPELTAQEQFPALKSSPHTPASDLHYNGHNSNYGRISPDTQMRQEQLRKVQQQMYQQQQQRVMQSQMGSASQVVNVVPVQQGTKGYSQLQQQIQREQMLQQDAVDGLLAKNQQGARIVTISQFIKSVTRLLGIGFPSIGCTETRLVAALVAVLGVRTGLDVWFSNFNARIVRAVVTYDRATLLRRLLPEYLGMMLPMAAVNQAIKWVISSLTIALRVRLGKYAHERYVDGITNITWTQLHHQGFSGSTPAHERPDWLLTVQIHRFADMFPRLLADVIKPTMDWFVFSRLLSRVIGRKGSLTMVLYIVLANIVIRLSSPPSGKHASYLAQLEEKYRNVYARISSTIQRAAAASTPSVFPHADKSASPSPHVATPQHKFVPRVQAAFRQRAKDTLDTSLSSVSSSVVSANIRRFFGGIGETILAKYGATLTAYYLLSRPLCTPGRRLASEILHDPAAVMMSYSRNSAYLINLSQATTRLLLMVSDLPKFVWSTVKVDRLLRSLDVHSRYRSVIDSSNADANSAYSSD
ncbi:hypothetical protein IWW36_000770 [Coemansia brasiliensis]|uniref:ABC transmembrane type-1 domain-containing protein n=1 Tax=Coemansia brasiliensis TaxID=2650707 RepID=A0A9W8M265_9FUNG|nr:hypothetical protein IWW36_000770 [Coemansia brasiliensis]